LDVQYIGILLGAHPVVHISRIRVNEEALAHWGLLRLGKEMDCIQ
jgi:hypothetical protein